MNDGKMYLVCGTAWEYNDEYYYQAEGDGKLVDKLFIKCEDAEARVLELCAEDLRNMETLDEMLGNGGDHPGWSDLTPVEQEPELYAKVLSIVGNPSLMPYLRDDEDICTDHDDDYELSEEEIEERWMQWHPSSNLPLEKFKELVPLFNLQFYWVEVKVAE